jgi:3D-(3,5/4)-trihydroxycyclohexane-1,2-dione acylhydrolase (decyclizing)
LIIAGGGVRYSQAESALENFATEHGIPVVETIAGKGTFTHHHPLHMGPIGILGSTSANELAANADVILAIGTRLMDFVTGSWTVFSHDAQFITLNAARFDAHKHLSLPLVCDAREGLNDLHAALGNWRADAAWLERGRQAFVKWNALIAEKQEPTPAEGDLPRSWVSSMRRRRRRLHHQRRRRLPGELVKGWRKNPLPSTVSSASPAWVTAFRGLGVAMARLDRDVIVMIGAAPTDDELGYLLQRPLRA